MKADRLNCPKCGSKYPVLRLFFFGGWRMYCPSCGIRLKLSRRSAGTLGAVSGLTFGVVISVTSMFGSHRITEWPAILYFMLFAWVYGCILLSLFGSIEVAPQKSDFFPNQRGIFRLVSMAGILSLIVGGFGGWFRRFLPEWFDNALPFLMLAGLVCVAVGLINGRKNKQKKLQQTIPNKPSERD